MAAPHKKRDLVEEELSALRLLREAPRTAEAQARLARALAHKSNLVVAAAATLCADAELAELVPQLALAFARLLDAPAEADKGCRAKTALASALYRNGSTDERLLRRGLRLVQREPVWGGQQDCAAELRGVCALGLSFLSPSGVIEELADLLADPEPTARALCARALGASGREEALPLLRYKLRCGDPSNEVLLECCAGLLALAPTRTLPLLQELLEGADAPRREAAALALGGSRLAEAVPLLVRLSERLPPHEVGVAYTALAMLRSGPALEHLLGLIAAAPLSRALAVLRALAIHRYDDALRARTLAAVGARGDAALRRAADEVLA